MKFIYPGKLDVLLMRTPFDIIEYNGSIWVSLDAAAQ
jgi:hypothetical protein